MTDEQRTERLTGDSAAHRRRRFEPPPASTERTREVTRDGGPVRGGLLVMVDEGLRNGSARQERDQNRK